MEVITKANDAHVLMKLLCKQMDLSTRCSHIQFVEAFSKLQTDSRKYEMELKDIYLESLQNENIKSNGVPMTESS